MDIAMSGIFLLVPTRSRHDEESSMIPRRKHKWHFPCEAVLKQGSL